jgi:hypothetical protein
VALVCSHVIYLRRQDDHPPTLTLKEHFGLTRGDIYSTNPFPFIKPGGMSSAIPRKDLGRAARELGWPQIEIIAPALLFVR